MLARDAPGRLTMLECRFNKTTHHPKSGFSQDHAYLPSKNKDRLLCLPKHNFSVKQLASHGTVAPLIFHAGYGWYPECANLYPSGED